MLPYAVKVANMMQLSYFHGSDLVLYNSSVATLSMIITNVSCAFDAYCDSRWVQL